MHFGIESMFEQTVVSAFDDGKPKIARMAEGIKPGSLLTGFGLQDEMALGLALGRSMARS